MFHVEAPDATSVDTTFRDCSPSAKGEDGAWYGYTRPLDVGFHYYLLKIDGAEVPDPNSRMCFGALRWGNAIEIPPDDQDFYTLSKVPHGQLREIYFHSPSTESERRTFVYTTPGYDQQSDKRNPVLCLQHGWGEDEFGFGQQGPLSSPHRDEWTRRSGA